MLFSPVRLMLLIAVRNLSPMASARVARSVGGAARFHRTKAYVSRPQLAQPGAEPPSSNETVRSLASRARYRRAVGTGSRELERKKRKIGGGRPWVIRKEKFRWQNSVMSPFFL